MGRAVAAASRQRFFLTSVVVEHRELAAVHLQLLAIPRKCEHEPLGPRSLDVLRLNSGSAHGERQFSAAGLPFHRWAGDLQVGDGPVLLRLAPQREGDRPAAQHLMPTLTDKGVVQIHVAQLRLALGNQVADDEVARAAFDDQLRQVSSLRRRLALFRLGDGHRNFTVTLALCLARSHRDIAQRVLGRYPRPAGGSSTASIRPPEEAHPVQNRVTSNGAANEGPRKTRAKQLKNCNRGDMSDIMIQ